jgi:hypothetical protein
MPFRKPICGDLATGTGFGPLERLRGSAKPFDRLLQDIVEKLRNWGYTVGNVPMAARADTGRGNGERRLGRS